MRRALAFLLVVAAGCDPSGAHLSLQLPAQLDPQQVSSIVVEVQGKTANRLGPTATAPGETLTDDGRLLISLDQSAFHFQSQLEVILQPTSQHAVATGVGACALGTGGGLLAVARPIDLAFPASSAPPLTFACGRASCLPETLPPYQEIDGESGDNLTPLALSHYTATDDTFIVAGAPTRTNNGAATGAVLLVARAPRSCPESASLADRIIYGRAGDRLGLAAAVGDYDGDGLEDLAVSGNAADGSGVVFVIPNPVLLGSPVIDLGDDTQRAAVYQIDGNGADGFGAQLAFAPLQRTTAAESLIITAPTGSADAAADGTGLVYILYGTATNRSSHTLAVGVPLAADGLVVRGAGAGTELATVLVADANSDGTNDLVASYSSGKGGEVGIIDSKLLGAGGELKLSTNALTITGTGDRAFGAAVTAGSLVRADKVQTWNLVVGSPNEGKVIALAVTAALWQVGGVPPAAPISYKDARLAAYTVLGAAGFGNALVLGTLPNQTANTLVVANDRVGQVAALRALPGTTLDVRNSAQLDDASVAVLQRADAEHFGNVLRAAKSLADFVVGGPLANDPRGMIAFYALPSS